jgi:predicted ATPase/DNA-binding XRE family transcriptional regulator
LQSDLIMEHPATHPFGDLLRHYRLANGLSQEQLADRAGVSARAVSALERGDRRTPHRATVGLLADALELSADHRAELDAAVTRRRGPATAPSPPVSPPLGHLPSPVTSFIGRAAEEAAVRRVLRTARLLTLTGTGGVGKTRLAVRVAEGLRDRYPDGVWLVELAPVADPQLIPQAVAQAVGVREAPGTPLLDAIAETLRGAVLLVVDNCEHLRAGVAEFVTQLRQLCPQLSILTTSREPLGITGETVIWVPSLALPEPIADGSAPGDRAARVLQADAAQLFDARARMASPSFHVTDANAAAVAAICRRLDGIPLALELAAARTLILTPEQIAARLDERLRLLTRTDLNVPLRQRTLQAALDWSYDILTEAERRLLAQLSVFAGGCDIEAAEAVCIDHGDDPDGLFEHLMSLVRKSLLVVEYRGETARFRMLETVREYAQAQLAARGEGEDTHGRHVAWALSLAERPSSQLDDSERAVWLERMETEHDNMRAALGWSIAHDDATTSIRLAIALRPFWSVRSHFHEGRSWFARALACSGDLQPALRARALDQAAGLAYMAGDPDAMAELAQQRLGISRALGDRRGVARALLQIGGAAMERRDMERARTAWEESLSLMRELGDEEGIADGISNLAALANIAGDHTQAATLYEESIALHRARASQQRVLANLRLLGEVLLERGEYGRVRAYAEEGVAIGEELGERWNTAGMWRLLGLVAAGEGDLARARALLEQSLAQYREIGNRWSVAETLYHLAGTLLRLGDVPGAEPLLQESLTLCHELAYHHFLAGVLRSLGDAARLRGDLHAAAAYLTQSLDANREFDELTELAPTLEALAATAAAGARMEDAARLLGAATTVRESKGLRPRPHADPPMDGVVASLGAALGTERYAAAYADGTALTREDAIARAITIQGRLAVGARATSTR